MIPTAPCVFCCAPVPLDQGAWCPPCDTGVQAGLDAGPAIPDPDPAIIGAAPRVWEIDHDD